jgi:acyl phosphate:glycerol-3-phosphate acyltransferase
MRPRRYGRSGRRPRGGRVLGQHGGVVARLAVAVVAGYLIGSIPVAVLAGRRRGVDPRDVGDRNPGYWNVREHLDRRTSLVVFTGDLAKGAAAGAVGVALDAPAWGIAHAAVGAAMVGHAFPVFAGFRGGRSVLTFVGGIAVLAPVPAAAAVVLLLVAWAVTRSFAWAARAGVFGFPVVQLLFETKERVAATGALMAIIGLRFAQAAVAERRSARAQ